MDVCLNKPDFDKVSRLQKLPELITMLQLLSVNLQSKKLIANCIEVVAIQQLLVFFAAGNYFLNYWYSYELNNRSTFFFRCCVAMLNLRSCRAETGGVDGYREYLLKMRWGEANSDSDLWKMWCV